MDRANDFDRAVQVVYPYLSETLTVQQSSIESLTELVGVGRWLLDNLHQNRGPSFETLRSLSIADQKKYGIVGRLLAGDGSTDSDVESFVEIHLGSDLKAAVFQIVEKASDSGSDFFKDEANRQVTLNHVATEILEGPPLASYSEAELDQRFEAFKEQVRQHLASPGIVIDLMLTSENKIIPTEAMYRAGRRNAKGKYSKKDLALFSSYAAEKYGPTVELVARLQRSFGWEAITWDPVSEVDRLGRR